MRLNACWLYSLKLYNNYFWKYWSLDTALHLRVGHWIKSLMSPRKYPSLKKFLSKAHNLLAGSVHWGLCPGCCKYSGQTSLKRAQCPRLRMFNCVFFSVCSQLPSSRTSLSEQKRFKTKPAAAFWTLCTLFCMQKCGKRISDGVIKVKFG